MSIAVSPPNKLESPGQLLYPDIFAMGLVACLALMYKEGKGTTGSKGPTPQSISLKAKRNLASASCNTQLAAGPKAAISSFNSSWLEKAVVWLSQAVSPALCVPEGALSRLHPLIAICPHLHAHEVL